MRFRNSNWAGCIDAIEDWEDRFGGEDPAMQHVFARCQVLMNRHNQARSSYRSLCEGDPENVTLWRERGLLAWSQHDWRTLDVCTAQLEILRPEAYESTLFRAVCAREQGETGRAQTMLEGLAEAFPERSEAWALLSSLRSDAGDLRGASKAQEIAVKCDPALADLPRVANGSPVK
jgi:predicted Zn-dependent protease